VTRWRILTFVLAAGFFALALSQQVYDATSPTALSWHVVLRKIYSVGTFALIAFCLRQALSRDVGFRVSLIVCGTVLAAYSAAIEVGQAAVGSREGFGWNGVDVLCGAIGGAIGAMVAEHYALRRTRDG
jgi:hypothetical protein